jgi:hypothetical protein
MNATTKTVRTAAIIAPPMPDLIRVFGEGINGLGLYG